MNHKDIKFKWEVCQKKKSKTLCNLSCTGEVHPSGIWRYLKTGENKRIPSTTLWKNLKQINKQNKGMSVWVCLGETLSRLWSKLPWTFTLCIWKFMLSRNESMIIEGISHQGVSSLVSTTPFYYRSIAGKLGELPAAFFQDNQTRLPTSWQCNSATAWI